MPAAQALQALGDPSRREIFERLIQHPSPVGELARDLPISRPAVSQHLKVLRDGGFARVRPDGARRLYAVEPEPFREVDAWLEHFHRFWEQRLDSLATELARGKRERRPASSTDSPKESTR